MAQQSQQNNVNILLTKLKHSTTKYSTLSVTNYKILFISMWVSWEVPKCCYHHALLVEIQLEIVVSWSTLKEISKNVNGYGSAEKYNVDLWLRLSYFLATVWFQQKSFLEAFKIWWHEECKPSQIQQLVYTNHYFLSDRSKLWEDKQYPLKHIFKNIIHM